MGGQPAPMNPSQPALMAPGNQMQGVQQGQPVQMQAGPAHDAVLWLLSNPERNAAAFDKKFGPNASKMALDWAKQNGVTVSEAQNSQSSAPYAPHNLLRNLFGFGAAQ